MFLLGSRSEAVERFRVELIARKIKSGAAIHVVDVATAVRVGVTAHQVVVTIPSVEVIDPRVPPKGIGTTEAVDRIVTRCPRKKTVVAISPVYRCHISCPLRRCTPCDDSRKCSG